MFSNNTLAIGSASARLVSQPFSQVQTAPQITPEVARWILLSRAQGMPRQVLVASLKGSGWNEASASLLGDASPELLIDIVTRGAIAANQPNQAKNSPAAEAQPLTGLYQRTSCPKTMLKPDQTSFEIDCRQMKVVASASEPHIVVVEGFMSSEECAHLRTLAARRLKRSTTLEQGAEIVVDARTSSGCFLRRNEDPIVSAIEARLATFCDWPQENGEELQILHYGVGAEYKPHHDYFDPAKPSNAPTLARGGQRVGTVVMYLNTPDAGGATVFPDIGLTVHAVEGSAVFFSYDTPHPASRSLHGGAPVTVGEKWVATKWMRQRRFV